MDHLQLLLRQTKDAYGWANRLIDGIPFEEWDGVPCGMESNVTWQVGHLVVSYYYHSIWAIAGHQIDLLHVVPMKEYGELFTKSAPAAAIGKTEASALRQHLSLVEQKSISLMGSLSPYQWDSPLEAITPQHPIAQTKLEAIDWNIKHTMWHCGQLAMLKRSINGRFEFGI